MSYKDVLESQKEGMHASARYGLLGLHLASGPLTGFALGYGLDLWLLTGPWCKMIFLFLGIGAGFLNVWRDSKDVIRDMDKPEPSLNAGLDLDEQRNKKE